MRLIADYTKYRCIIHMFFLISTCLQAAYSQCTGSTIVYTSTDVYQTFTSLNYPFGYGNYQNCVWRIEADNVTNAIRLEIRDASIEYHENCVYDYGEVFDGYNTTADSLGKFCGTGEPAFVSNGNTMTITFVSDYSLTSKGFKARYKSGPRSLLVDTDDVPEQFSRVTIIGATIGSVVFIVVVLTIFYTYIQAKKAKELRRHPHMRRGLGLTRVEPFGYGGDWNYLDGPAPPAYGEIYSSPMSPPPEYCEIDQNPNSSERLPGRAEYMRTSQNNGGNDVIINEQRQLSQRGDANANSRLIILNSLYGHAIHVNNHTNNIRTSSQTSTSVATTNSVQTLNNVSLHDRTHMGTRTTDSVSNQIDRHQIGSLPHAVAPLSTESAVRSANISINSSECQTEGTVATTRQIMPIYTVTSPCQTMSANTVTSHDQILPAHTLNRQAMPNCEDTSSTASDMSLSSSRSISMYSESSTEALTPVS